MSLQIGDSVNCIHDGGFNDGPGVIIEQIDMEDPYYATDSIYGTCCGLTNPAWKVQFSDGNWTILSETCLVKVGE